MAAPLVGLEREGLMDAARSFYKMSGSGNDFVFFDLREGPAADLETEGAIRALSARGTGVGADGVVFLEPGGRDSFSIRYYNSDGSRGELCGNATLCALRLSQEVGIVSGTDISIQTDAGVISARMVDGLPEIDLAPVSEVRLEAPEIPRLDRESRLGFARAGVPHIVIVDSDVATADVVGRGSIIRRDRSLKDGANVNFVSSRGDRWAIRTYERGVEGETLACGTGAVATGILLTEWGVATSPVRLETRSGRELQVRVKKEGNLWHPSLRGSAEIVFTGQLRDLDLSRSAQ
jgi:diaminopimelate epimerase